jgi:hypothetical protein
MSGNGLKEVGALSPLPLNVALENAVMNIQVKQDDMEMTHKILISFDDINFLGRTIRKIYYKDKHRRFIGFYYIYTGLAVNE